MKRQNSKKAAIIMVLFCLFPRLGFSDMTSTNYSMSGRITGGNGSGNSSSYQVEQSSIDCFLQPALSSTSYQLGSGAEAATAANMVKINSVSPADHPFFYSGSTADYTVTAVDPDNDSLQYRAKQDGTLKEGPQASNALSWALSNNDLGKRAMEFAVIDPDGTVVENRNAYVVRQPVK